MPSLITFTLLFVPIDNLSIIFLAFISWKILIRVLNIIVNTNVVLINEPVVNTNTNKVKFNILNKVIVLLRIICLTVLKCLNKI